MNFYNKKTKKNIKINFRKFEIKDTAQYNICISDFYDDGYPYKEFLDGEFLDKQCKKGKMIVVCGETSDGEIVSTSGINFDGYFKQSGTLMLRVVKKEFQNIGIGNKHQDFLLKQLDNDSKLQSLYADVMSHNITSQNSLVREDFVYTGIRFMLYHNKVMVPQYPFTHEFKLSQVVMCKNVNYNNVGDIYCPRIHSKFVKDIYQELGVDCDMNLDSNNDVKSDSKVSLHVDDIHNYLQILVFDIGNDFERVIKEQISHYNHIKGQTYICYLNMKDPSSIKAYEILLSYGFFFSGIKPLNANGEFMILSKIMGQALNADDIKIHGNGRHLIEYIIKNRK